MKTNTQEHTAQHDTYQTVDQTSWDDTSHFVTSLSTEPDFISYTAERGIDDKYSLDYADALALYAENSLTQQEGLIDDATATQIRLVANAPYMAHASEAINQYNDRRKKREKLPQDEWNHFNQLKEQAVWYNQMLSGYMYDNPDESFGAISQAISDQAIDHARDTQHIAQTVDGVVRGARTEAATRHLLEAARVPFREATIQEDLRGADIMLQLSSGEYSVDIKKSLDQLASSYGGYDFTESGEMFVVDSRRGEKKLLFFPGFTDVDLGDRLTLPQHIVDERKDIVAGQLMRASLQLAA